MSFDLSFLAPAGETVSVQLIAEWLVADDRVAELSGSVDSFEAVTAVGGNPWAAFLVEDVSDLEPEDLAVEDGPDDLVWAGVRLEISYSTPVTIVVAIFELAAAFAQRFGLVMVDEQTETVEAVEIDELRTSWDEASAFARAAYERHLHNQSG